MPVIIEDRPIETVREEVVDRLIMNYSHEKISYQAFERRLDQAMASNDNHELLALVADLDLTVDQRYSENKKINMGAHYTSGETKALEYLVKIFSSGHRCGRWNVAREIRSVYVFSSGDLDFTDAQFSHPEVRIKMFGLFSSQNIYIPENVKVVSKAFCLFGSVDNRAPSHADINAPTIIIEGLAIFSSVKIGVKRSIKERLVAFADGLKKMFS